MKPDAPEIRDNDFLHAAPGVLQHATKSKTPTEESTAGLAAVLMSALIQVSRVGATARREAEWGGGPSDSDNDVPSSATLRELIDGLDAVVWESDPNGRIRFINRRATEFFGYPEDRWLSSPGFWLEIAHPDDRIEAERSFTQCARDGSRKEFEYRIAGADGGFLWVRQSLRPDRDHSGRVSVIRGVLWKIGRRKKLERRLYAARRDIATQLDDLAYLHDLSRRLWSTVELEPLLEETLIATLAILGAEMGDARLLDTEREELEIVASVGLPESYLDRYRRVSARHPTSGALVFEDVPAGPTGSPEREAARAGGYRSQYSALLMSRSGALLGTIAAYFHEPHQPSHRQARLVEAFVRQAADFVEYARLTRELREANQAKDNALATLAHELRNPLSVILSAAQTLGSDVLGDYPALLEVRDLIVHQAQTMSRLTSDLVDNSCLGRGRMELNLEFVDLESILVRAAESVQPLVQERDHKLMIVPPAEPLRVEVDSIRLEQILVNLLRNACRYSEPGGTITVSGEREGDECIVRVRDTGAGITAEMLPRIFDPFVRGGCNGRSSTDGLGLGLALVKGMVERHGGTVSAASDGSGLGSEFVVRLPIGGQRIDTSPLARERSSDATPPHPLDILVVDDQPELAQSLTRLLTSWGHRPAIAHDGPSAVVAVTHRRPDLVLLDVALPGMDGYEVARRLREQHGSSLTIAALSGYGRGGPREWEQAALFDHYLTKPVSLEDLQMLLETHGGGVRC